MGREPFVQTEIMSQPGCWRRAVEVAARSQELLPRDGERVAIVGCGTSWFMAQAYASLREATGRGETDAFAASEMPRGRDYDRLLAITRSGTTTEVLELLHQVRGRQPTLAVTADPASAVLDAADQAIVLDFADERSVVQTRFATTTLALLRASLGQDLEPVVAAAEQAVAADLPAGLLERTQFTFLGSGWTVGLANEAALKMREACSAWAESYPAMEYRHGPISITDARSAVWFLTPPPASLPEEVAATHALVLTPTGDPMAELVRVQRLSVALAAAKGLDPDRPRNLSRSVILSTQSG
ncbi:MAG TPA: SIS domain-containing protein [Actinomycetota bacterium]|nr:SIS domain-containing protein [Actinomycetota bacterium]